MICGPNDFANRGQRAERNHLAAAIADLEPADVVEFGAIVRLGLHPDLVDAAELVEVVHVRRAEVRLQRREHVAERDVEQLDLFAIDVDEHLRHAGTERRVERGEARLAAGRFHDFGDDLEQRRPPQVAAVLHLHLEAAADAQAANRRRGEGKHDRLLDRAEFRRSWPSRASSVRPLSRRSSQGLNVTNTVPVFGARALIEERQTADLEPILRRRACL